MCTPKQLNSTRLPSYLKDVGNFRSYNYIIIIVTLKEEYLCYSYKIGGGEKN